MLIDRTSTFTFAVLLAFVVVASRVASAADMPYYPPAGEWARKTPAELGMDARKIAEAVMYAQSHESTREMDFSDQQRIFGSLLGSIPTKRAKTNGVVIYKGYVVAEFGDTSWADPTYSVAKSMLSTVAGIAVRDGLIARLDAPVGATVKDGGYDSPHNARITWRMHLQQESEWQGNMWGKQDDFVGHEAFGDGERQPRALKDPGTYYEYNDVRINRFALSLLRTFKKPVPEVFRDEVMDPIGASSSWKWIPYANSYVSIDGKELPSVSGGTRWGGGVWIDSWDMARFGYLWLRDGKWRNEQIIPVAYVRAALTPSTHGPDYGYLWWLNTKRQRQALPTNAFMAMGAGGNTITVLPDHDLVVVWRWGAGDPSDFVKLVLAAIAS